MNKPSVTISMEEYVFLLERLSFLRHLERCGVDNWVGYGFACKTFNIEKDKSEE